ncbi:MAG TPA: LysM domain-containing protein [Solirubrobacterales bacterium]|nr:LysM domain-containing protein [Solirubrobacterales bacterium]
MSAQQQSPLRLLAPAALAVFAIAFLIVVIASVGGDGDTSTNDRAAATSDRERGTRNARQRREPRTVTRDNSNRRFYTVRAGDNLALIADRTGVPLEELRTLNPDLDPQALVTGQRVRLRGSADTGATGATGAQGDGSAQGGAE